MTQKAIGPNFSNELKAAHLTGLPFSWGADGSFHFADTMTQGQIDAVQAVYAAHDPAAPDLVTAAINALDASDTTMHRIGEAVALGTNSWTNADVVAWVNYRRTLRAIAASGSGTIPSRPAYPSGT